MATNFINLIGEKIKKGERFEAGQTYDSLAEGFKTAFVTMERRALQGLPRLRRLVLRWLGFPNASVYVAGQEGRFPWEESFEPRSTPISASWAGRSLAARLAVRGAAELTCFTLRQVVDENKPILRYARRSRWFLAIPDGNG